MYRRWRVKYMELDYSGDLIKMLFPFLHEPLACLGSSEPRNIQAEMIGHDSGYHDNQMDVNIFFLSSLYVMLYVKYFILQLLICSLT